MPRIDSTFSRALPCVVAAAALGIQLLPVLAEDATPSAFPKDRYASMRDHSPFALATVAAATPPPQASFAANWFVGGVGRIGDDYFVTIRARDLSTQFTIFANETVEGVSLASVDWSDQVGKSTVILRKGTETAKLEFNEAQLKAAAAGPVPGANPVPGVKPPMTAAAGVPPQNQRPVGVNMAAAANPNAPGMNGAPLRRRTLPIPVSR